MAESRRSKSEQQTMLIVIVIVVLILAAESLRLREHRSSHHHKKQYIGAEIFHKAIDDLRQGFLSNEISKFSPQAMSRFSPKETWMNETTFGDIDEFVGTAGSNYVIDCRDFEF